MDHFPTLRRRTRIPWRATPARLLRVHALGCRGRNTNPQGVAPSKLRTAKASRLLTKLRKKKTLMFNSAYQKGCSL